MDAVGILTSTPNTSRSNHNRSLVDSDISVVERSTSPPLLVTDDSISAIEGPARGGAVRSLAQVIATRASYPSRIHFDAIPKEGNGRDYKTLKDSISGRSAADSADEAERARCLEDKLHATLQILKNKEETVKVQAESLALAEERISSLSSRVPATAHRAAQVRPMMRNATSGCKVDSANVSLNTQTHGSDEKIVNTLRSNLSVIQQLYRECFYETAKQEQLIEMLRQSYLDVRVMEQEKTEQIGHLQYVVDTQRSSLQTYQEVAVEVENLKAEITRFLSNSNNDSGMWERGDETPLSDDLGHIVSQLHRLEEMLTGECTCGLVEENKSLKRRNEMSEVKIDELQQRVLDLEEALEGKENADQRYARLIQEKELELNRIRQQIYTLEQGSKEDCRCDILSSELQQVKGSLEAKTSELARVQQKCDQQEVAIDELREELLLKANNPHGEQLSALTAEVERWREQLGAGRRRVRALGAELQRCRQHYREKTKLAYELQAQLEEAHGRGAALCSQARRVLCTVCCCLRRQRQREREQEDEIRRQQTLIRRLQGSQTESQLNEPCCSKSIDMRFCASERESKLGSAGISANEMASCSPPPTPPRRSFRKKSHRAESSCSCSGGSGAGPSGGDRGVLGLREASPTAVLLERVERAHEALAHAHARWTRRGKGYEHYCD